MSARRRWGGSLLLGLALAVGIAACCAAARWRARAAPRPDAGLPLPGIDPRLLGPSLDQAVEVMRRRFGGPAAAECIE
jgi:hypothetical protein